MKRPSLLLLVAATVVTHTLGCAPCAVSPNEAKGARPHATPPGPVHHVVVVSVDGLMPDAYLNPDAHGLKVPTLRKLFAEGASSTGVLGVFPTVTYPSHTSMVTGVNPARHGIFSNHSFDPESTDQDGWRWYAEEIKADPVWRLAEHAGYHVGMVHWPVSAGADVSFRVPEYWRAGSDNDKKLLRALSTPGLLESVAAEHADFWSRYDPPASHDDALADIATHLILKEKPELLFLHLIEVDARQHHHGIWSPEALVAIENDDLQVSRLLSAIHDAGIASDTTLIVLSDHGFLDAPSAVRPGVLVREAGLLNRADGKPGWRSWVLVSGGQAYVYLRDKNDVAAATALRTLFATKAKEAGSGIGRVWDEREIAAAGGDPSALLAIEPAPGFQFAAETVGTYVAPAPYMATHGYDPQRPEMHASLLMRGPTVPHGTIEGARLIDIAPTVAAFLGLEMPGVEGRALRVTPAK